MQSKVAPEKDTAFGRKKSSITKSKNKEKLIKGINALDSDIFNMITNLEKNTIGYKAKPKRESKSESRKANTAKVSHKQTIHKADLVTSKKPNLYDDRSNRSEIKEEPRLAGPGLDPQSKVEKTTVKSVSNSVAEPVKDNQERKAFLSFGLLAGEDYKQKSEHASKVK